MMAYGYITKWTVDAQSAPTPTATPRGLADKDASPGASLSSSTGPTAAPVLGLGAKKEKRLLDRVARLVVLCNRFAEGRLGEPLQVRIFSVPVLLWLSVLTRLIDEIGDCYGSDDAI